MANPNKHPASGKFSSGTPPGLLPHDMHKRMLDHMASMPKHSAVHHANQAMITAQFAAMAPNGGPFAKAGTLNS